MYGDNTRGTQLTRKALLLPSRLFKHAEIQEVQEVQMHLHLHLFPFHTLEIPRPFPHPLPPTPTTLILSSGTIPPFQDSMGRSRYLLSNFNPENDLVFLPRIVCD